MVPENHGQGSSLQEATILEFERFYPARAEGFHSVIRSEFRIVTDDYFVFCSSFLKTIQCLCPLSILPLCTECVPRHITCTSVHRKHLKAPYLDLMDWAWRLDSYNNSLRYEQCNFTEQRMGNMPKVYTASERTLDAGFKLAGSLGWVPGEGYFLYVRRRDQMDIW